MQSELIKELFETINTKLLTLIFQMMLSGVILLWVKDIVIKTINYIKVKFSDFGRGTKLEINGKVGYLLHVGFNEVEMEIDKDTTMFIPVEKFVCSTKIIRRNINGN